MGATKQINPETYNPFLYPAFEASRDVLEATGAVAKIAFSGMRANMMLAEQFGSPFAGAGLRLISASEAMAERLTRRYERVGFNIERVAVGDEVVPIREKIIADRPHAALLHFERETNRSDPKVFLCAPRSGHPSDLLRDTARQLLSSGHDVYINDIKNARDVPLEKGDYGLDDCAEDYIDFIKKLGPDAHIVAVCQATVPVMMAVSYLAKHEPDAMPASLTLMGGPLDPSAAPSQVTEFADVVDLDWFASTFIGKVPAGYAGVGRKVLPGFMQIANFMAMNPDSHINKHLDLFIAYLDSDVNLDSATIAKKIERFYNYYFGPWDMPAKYDLETIQRGFKDRELASGTAYLRGQLLEPAAITNTPVMTVEGENDDISAPGQTAAIHSWLTGLPAELQYHYLQPDTGHYGIFSGRKWASEIAPRITSFIRAEAKRRSQTYDNPSLSSIEPAIWRKN